MTVATLHSHLENISRPACGFAIQKVHRDHVSIRADYKLSGVRKHPSVVLPAYPTGNPSDDPCSNLNVVLDPIAFIDADTSADRYVFLPLLGRDILAHYERLHQEPGLSVSRCC